MLTIRPAETDDDLEAWRRVRLAVLPYERCSTVAEIRKSLRPGRLLLLAELDGILAGHGITAPSDIAGRASVAPRVLPGFRRRGVGTALLRALAEHAYTEMGFRQARALVDDAESMGFAARFGFTEIDRQVEQVRAIGTEPRPQAPAGVEIVSIAERPDLWSRAYADVAAAAVHDMALEGEFQVTLEQWESDWINAPEASFVAVTREPDELVVGLASLLLDQDVPDRAEHGFTAVRRDHRGRGIASALKRQTLWWAAEHGISEVYTWTQRGNEDMRRLNEHLGFGYRTISITTERELPIL